MIKKLLLFIFIMITGIAAKAAGGCPSFTFSFTTLNPTCPTTPDGAAFVSVTGGTPPYTYAWDPGAGSQLLAAATLLTAGNYYVIVTDGAGCVDTGYVSLTAPATQTPEICMVTCDAHSVNNIVYWDKTPYTNVDSFIVYREVTAGVYSRIGIIDGDSLSEFEDTARSVGPANGDPNIAAYRYKLQIRDICGNYGGMSPYHNTIHIVDAGAGEFSWAIPYMIEGASTPVNNYILLCDTANVDIWGPVSTVSSSTSAAIDPGFATHGSIANWRVKTDWAITCTPTRATVNTSRSNIKHGLVTTGIGIVSSSDRALVYPNPATGQLSISLAPDLQSGRLRMVNALGQQVMTDMIYAASVKHIDITGFAKGIYTVIIEYEGGTIYKKLVVN